MHECTSRKYVRYKELPRTHPGSLVVSLIRWNEWLVVVGSSSLGFFFFFPVWPISRGAGGKRCIKSNKEAKPNKISQCYFSALINTCCTSIQIWSHDSFSEGKSKSNYCWRQLKNRFKPSEETQDELISGRQAKCTNKTTSTHFYNTVVFLLESYPRRNVHWQLTSLNNKSLKAKRSAALDSGSLKNDLLSVCKQNTLECGGFQEEMQRLRKQRLNTTAHFWKKSYNLIIIFFNIL